MFCPKCGKELRQGANFCMYCGTPVGDIENENIQNAIYEDIIDVEYTDMTEEDNEYSTYENEKLSFQKILKKYDNAYSNCENGKVSFLKMLKKFFSKEIKEYFSFDGTYSRLEYFYFNLIINVVFFIFDPWFQQYFPFMLLPSVIVHLWLHISSAVKRLKDLGFSSLGIIIPIICIFVGRTNKDNPAFIVPSIFILIFYQIYTIFVLGKNLIIPIRILRRLNPIKTKNLKKKILF